MWIQDQDIGTVTLVAVSYDSLNHRTRSFVEAPYNEPGYKVLEAILLYDENRFFFIVESKKLCIVTNAFFEFQTADMPADAQFRHHFTRGMKGNAVTTNTFGKPYEDKDGEHTWYTTVTNDTCVPVLENVYKGNTLDYVAKVQVEKVIRYIDMSEGIKQESVFDPPAFCNATDSTTMDIDDVFDWYRFMYIS